MADGDIVERVQLATPSVAAARIIASPFQFYFDGTDNLRVEGWNAVTNTSLLVTGRFLNMAGAVDVFSYTIALTADRVRTRRDIAMAQGFMLNLAVIAIGSTPKIGQTFVRVQVIRGLTTATVALGTMLQHYLTADHGLGWPGSPIIASTEIEPVPRDVAGTQPAAGAEINEVVPTNTRWELVALLASLACSATAATRVPRLQADGSSLTHWISPSSGSVTASDTRIFTWAQGLPHETPVEATRPVAGLPVGAWLPAGLAVRTNTAALQAGDQWSTPALLVRELLEVQ